jgi:hypothetical protein
MNLYLKYAKEKIKIDDKPFASGGEGNLFKILSPRKYKNSVAKLYHTLKLNQQRFEKIEYLYHNPPYDTAHSEHKTFVWVEDILLNEQNEFVGLIMPFIKGEKLEVLTALKLPKHLGYEWRRFDPDKESSQELRLRICFNLAIAIYRIHSTHKYVLVDLKPDNVIVQPDGLLSLVDMDSVEVVENGNVKFPAPVSTPEYTPPESYRNARKNEDDAIDTDWDLFSLSVIMYRILFGIHPFAASSKAPYDQLVTLHDKIREGLFVHNDEIQQHFSVIPPPHAAFSKISLELQSLFKKTFINGHLNADLRPSSEEWCYELLNIFGDENLKIHFQKIMLISLQNISKNLLPSQIIALPKISLGEKDILSDDYIELLNWEPPLLKKQRIFYRSKSKLGIRIGDIALSVLLTILIVLPIYLFFPFIFYNFLELGSASFIILQSLLIIPIVIMPYLLRKYIFSKYDTNYRIWSIKFKEYQILQLFLKNAIPELGQSKEKLAKFIPLELKNARDSLLNFTNSKSEQLKSLIAEQDRNYKSLLDETKNNQEKIIAACLAELFKNTMFSNYRNLNDIRTIKNKLKQQLQSKLSEQSLEKISDNKINSSDLNVYIKNELETIELNKKQFLAKLNKDYQNLQKKEKSDITTINYNFNLLGNIAKSYKKYLSKVPGNLNQIVANLQKAGLNNISQIESINHMRHTIYLKNNVIIALEHISNSGILSLATKLEFWKAEYLKMEQKYQDELLRHKKIHESIRTELKKEETEGLATFDHKISNLKLDYKKIILEKDIQNINSEFQKLFDLIKATEQEIQIKLRELDKDFKEKSKIIIQNCSEILNKEQGEINAFKKVIKENLEVKLRLEGLENQKNTAMEKFEKIVLSIDHSNALEKELIIEN